jgi:hypothetical protein
VLIVMAAVPDPQLDEDTLIQRVRDGAHEARKLVETWRGYAANSRSRAAIAHQLGNEFDQRLWGARAKTRDAAAQVLLTQNPAEAAAAMMNKAKECHVKTPPLIGYDEAAVDYTRARVWQDCAWGIDSSLPEVQPEWL